MNKWYILRTASNCEFKVHIELDKCDISVFTPCEFKAQRVNQYCAKKNAPKMAVPYPLYRSYVFAKVPFFHPILSELKNMKLVYGFLGRDGNPFIVSQDEIDVMDAKCDFNQFDVRLHAKREQVEGAEAYMRTGLEFKVGDLVQFEKGFHSQMQLEVLSFERQDTAARVLVRGLFKDTEQTIPITDLILLETQVKKEPKAA
ncbi:MAG: hypothetical protein COA43_11110 [Robiginitomaculum sp.]|nr:MAG: hypothetical protein COA43_11110 [Robiginitomaculum sp.]